MSPMPLGILALSGAGGFAANMYSAYSLTGVNSDYDIVEVNGTVLAQYGTGVAWRQVDGGSWSSVSMGTGVASIGANANVFVGIPNIGDPPAYIRKSSNGSTWTDVAGTFAYWNTYRHAMADKKDPTNLYAVHMGRNDTEITFWSDDNGLTKENAFSYSTTNHQIGAHAARSTEWMMIVSISQSNSNDYMYWIGTDNVWTQYTASLNWNDGSRSVTSDGTYYYGTRGNSKQIWRRTGTNTFTTITTPDNLSGDKRLVYAFGKFLYWNSSYASYWYADAWNGPYTQVSTGTVKLAADNRRNLVVSDILGKVYVQRYDTNGYVTIG